MRPDRGQSTGPPTTTNPGSDDRTGAEPTATFGRSPSWVARPSCTLVRTTGQAHGTITDLGLKAVLLPADHHGPWSRRPDRRVDPSPTLGRRPFCGPQTIMHLGPDDRTGASTHHRPSVGARPGSSDHPNPCVARPVRRGLPPPAPPPQSVRPRNREIQTYHLTCEGGHYSHFIARDTPPSCRPATQVGFSPQHDEANACPHHPIFPPLPA